MTKPCHFCGNPPGEKVGPPPMARCITPGCEGTKLAAKTIAEWDRQYSSAIREALGLLQDSSCFRGEVCSMLPCACAETLAARLGGVAQGSQEPINFFSDNVDAWGAAEWFSRLATAIRQQDAAVLAKDDVTMEICRNVAASSAMRLVREYEPQVRHALLALASPPAALPAGENLPTLDEYRNNLIEECVKLIRYCGECDCPRMTAAAIKGLAIPSTSRTCPDCGMREACDDECPNAPLPSAESK